MKIILITLGACEINKVGNYKGILKTNDFIHAENAVLKLKYFKRSNIKSTRKTVSLAA